MGRKSDKKKGSQAAKQTTAGAAVNTASARSSSAPGTAEAEEVMENSGTAGVFETAEAAENTGASGAVLEGSEGSGAAETAEGVKGPEMADAVKAPELADAAKGPERAEDAGPSETAKADEAVETAEQAEEPEDDAHDREEPQSVIYTDEEESRPKQQRYFDYHDAMIQIEMLFQSHILSFGYKEYSLETFVDRKYFASWHAREGCEDTDEMRAGLNIDGILRSDDPSESEVLTYLQYTLNIAELCRRSFNKVDVPGYDFDIRNYTELLSRIREILKHLNYEVRYIPEKEFIFLVPYDPAMDAAAETDNDPVAAAIVEYRSSAAIGRLDRKRRLLMELGTAIEAYPDNLRTENSVLYNHIQFMLNHMSIRHDNTEGEDRIRRVAEMTGQEMEAWYDETYQMMLLRILQHANKERITRIDNLAEECGSAVSSISEEEMTRLLNGEFDDPVSLPEEESAPPRRAEVRREEPDPVPPVKNTTVRNVVIAVIAADLVFVLFVLLYLFVL